MDTSVTEQGLNMPYLKILAYFLGRIVLIALYKIEVRPVFISSTKYLLDQFPSGLS